MSSNIPTAADKDELLLSCRYGDIEDVQLFADKYGAETLSGIRDDNGNTVLHMICGNGHADLLDHLLPIIPPSLLSEKNAAQSTPLHWAALNSHLACAQKLVQLPGGPGVDLIDIKNAAGHSPLAEAEFAGWDEGAKWFVEVMNLETDDSPNEEADEGLRNETEPALDKIDVTIEDADGQLATMTIDAGAIP
ncbi:ankyrin [Armillaria solidipes]|uniref:Ankyrin n=1 Tax=Armillaria solidipes TaxID=1076256 RepID=A0A2H3C2P5_9AGAR|nr:ankyrin [Armillaria solidipes]